jgi:hypothetical protein
MYQLHYFPGNANAEPHMVLDELGQKYDLALVDPTENAQKSKEYLKINPNRQRVDLPRARATAPSVVARSPTQPGFAWRHFAGCQHREALPLTRQTGSFR